MAYISYPEQTRHNVFQNFFIFHLYFSRIEFFENIWSNFFNENEVCQQCILLNKFCWYYASFHRNKESKLGTRFSTCCWPGHFFDRCFILCHLPQGSVGSIPIRHLPVWKSSLVHQSDIYSKQPGHPTHTL